MRRSLFKYFSERIWAEKLLEGEALFRSLSYFQDCEDKARADQNEGTSVFKPDGGLVLTKQDGTIINLPASFESSAKSREIFAFCLSRSLSTELATQFNAVACVEITDIPAFCARMKAGLPATATFFGGRVTYYDSCAGPEARWALPEQIAVSKLRRFAHEMEFRVGFTLTNALDFENVDIKIVQGNKPPCLNAEAHPEYRVDGLILSDIARLHKL